MTVAAAGDRLDGDARPGRRPAGAFTERDDFSRGFMSDDERTRNRTVAAAIDAVEQQEIGAAEARRTNPDERFAGPGNRRGGVEHVEMADPRRRLDDRPHDGLLCRQSNARYQPRISMRASVQFRMMLR